MRAQTWENLKEFFADLPSSLHWISYETTLTFSRKYGNKDFRWRDLSGKKWIENVEPDLVRSTTFSLRRDSSFKERPNMCALDIYVKLK